MCYTEQWLNESVTMYSFKFPFYKAGSKMKTFNNLHMMCLQHRGNMVKIH